MGELLGLPVQASAHAVEVDQVHPLAVENVVRLVDCVDDRALCTDRPRLAAQRVAIRRGRQGCEPVSAELRDGLQQGRRDTRCVAELITPVKPVRFTVGIAVARQVPGQGQALGRGDHA